MESEYGVIRQVQVENQPYLRHFWVNKRKSSWYCEHLASGVILLFTLCQCAAVFSVFGLVFRNETDVTVCPSVHHASESGRAVGHSGGPRVGSQLTDPSYPVMFSAVFLCRSMHMQVVLKYATTNYSHIIHILFTFDSTMCSFKSMDPLKPKFV
jgi:hypothetical protein